MRARLRFESEITALSEGAYWPRQSQEVVNLREAEAGRRRDGLGGTTLYLPFRLSPATPPKIGVYVPDGLRADGAIPFIIYLHGNIDPCTEPANKGRFEVEGMEFYWNSPPFRVLREALDSSGVKAVLVAPTLTKKFGHSGSPSADRGNLNQAGRLDALLDEVLASLQSTGAVQGTARVGTIVLAGHSAGGRPMQEILAAKNRLGSQITECWGFECLYFGTATLERWLRANPDRRFRHYRRKTHFAAPTTALKKLGNFIDVSDGTNHCLIVRQSWGRALSAWLASAGAAAFTGAVGAVAGMARLLGTAFGAVVPQPRVAVGAAAHPISPAAMVAAEPAPAAPPAPPARSSPHLVFTTAILAPSRIPVAKAGDAKKQTLVEVRVAPSVFLPEIVGLARRYAASAGRSDLAATLNPDTWFSRFTRTSFLGCSLKKDQYVHESMANLLASIEAYLVREIGGTATSVGDVLLHGRRETIAGSRRVSGTATFSMHMFGLAVDINYVGNPYIHTTAQITELNRVLRNAVQLSGAPSLEYRKGSTFDAIHRLDAALEEYFRMALPQGRADLLRMLATSHGKWTSRAARSGVQSHAWRSMNPDDARNRIDEDAESLAKLLARGKFLQQFRERAILDFDKRFVVGMQRHGMDWGGSYGDMMHFDMRTTGAGVYIQRARLKYLTNARALAQRLHGDKQYGPHLPAASLATP